jgi:sulfite exporter TauE/SafE
MNHGGFEILLGTAISVGIVHSALGPDHYLPFAALSHARGWSRRKTLIITALCGVGHVAGSVILGLLGIALGWTLGSMTGLEALRGDFAAWALIGFGLAYGVWGLRRGLRRKPHSHFHTHANGTSHDHPHNHLHHHVHTHVDADSRSMTPWALFIVFVLGPCEPLIPILMVPAAEHSVLGIGLVACVFAVSTIATMCAMVFVLSAGLSLVKVGHLERWAHALAGFSILVCGAGIKWLGL